ncbi:HNH endonuclease [Cetobacterium sp.]|uniref:HNH endonuclease n=1 Tax=Cetobacterium sp. TaxID=2071632 RepID=UPI003F2A1A57
MSEIFFKALEKVISSDKPGVNIEIPKEKLDHSKLNYDAVYRINNNKEISTRNSDLEGKNHPETEVSFVRKTVETEDSKKEGVFPVFDSILDVKLPEELEKESDRDQFKYCNEKLKESLEKNPELKEKFTEEQLEQIEAGETPDGYTWHHSEDKGKMELVDTETHSRTGHTGGRSIWGGGSDSR